MEYFVQQLINGITLGSIYGLIAIGYSMVYGIIGMINFAHGDVFMVGAFISLIFILLLTAVGASSMALLVLWPGRAHANPNEGEARNILREGDRLERRRLAGLESGADAYLAKQGLDGREWIPSPALILPSAPPPRPSAPAAGIDDRSGQGQGHRLLLVRHDQDRRDGTEDLLAGQAHGVGDAAEHRRLEEVTRPRRVVGARASGEERGPFLLPQRHVRLHLLELGPGHQGTDLGLGVVGHGRWKVPVLPTVVNVAPDRAAGGLRDRKSVV